MGEKFYRLKFTFILLTTVLSIYIIYITKNQSMSNPTIMLGLIGLLVAVSGNYFQILPQNKFFGIRTPWTLKNEQVWRATHRMAGKYWLIGGLLIIFSCLFFNRSINIVIFLSVTLVIILVPTIYSYISYRKYKKSVS